MVITMGDGRREEVATELDMMEVALVVLSICKWVQTEHIVADAERSDRRLYGLHSRFYYLVY